VGSEQVGDGEGVGDDVRRLGLQILGHVKHGRAAVHDDGLVRLDQLGAGLADQFLFRKLPFVAVGEDEFIGVRGHQTGAAMGASDCAGGFEGGEVSANGGRRHIQLFRQFIQGGKLHLAQVILDSLLTLFGGHGDGCVTDIDKSCKIMVDSFWEVLKKFAQFVERDSISTTNSHE